MTFKKDDNPYARRDYSKDSDNPYARKEDYGDNPYARHYDPESDNIYKRHFKSGEEIKHESIAKQTTQRESLTKTKDNDPYSNGGTDPYARNYDPSSDNIYQKHIDEEGNDRDNKNDLQNDNIRNAKVQRAETSKNTTPKMTEEQRQRLEKLKEQNRQKNAANGIPTAIPAGTAVTKADLAKRSNHIQKRFCILVIFYMITNFVKVLVLNLSPNGSEDGLLLIYFAVFVGAIVMFLHSLKIFYNFSVCTYVTTAVCTSYFKANSVKTAIIEYEVEKTRYKKEMLNNPYLPEQGETLTIKVCPTNPKKVIPKLGSTVDLIYSFVAMLLCIRLAMVVFPFIYTFANY